MGRFDPHVDVYCQNDEVSPDVHIGCHAKGSSDTPTGPVSKLTPGTGSSSDSAREPHGILNGLEITRFTGDYD